MSCDAYGSNKDNFSLGKSYAISIRDYMVMLGIDRQRIQTKSHGKEKPVITERTEANWYRNCRGEFAIFRRK